MIQESADFLPPQRRGKPLHVVLYEYLHGVAVDRMRPLNCHAYTAPDRHVRAKQNFFCHFERSEAESRNLSLTF
jgi:hypothetical protein